MGADAAYRVKLALMIPVEGDVLIGEDFPPVL
jgi:hypothetical protein